MVRAVAGVLAAALLLAGCAAVAAGSESSDGVRVSFYGDSYTRGKAASAESARWSTIVSAAHGWTELNHGIDGLGFVRQRASFADDDVPSAIIAEQPDMVIVALGLNDNFVYDRAADRIREQIGVDFDRLADGLPDARIIVVEPFWYSDQRPDSVDVIAAWVRDSAAEHGFEYIAGASRWLEGHPEWMADDVLHPNDAGYAELARRMNEELAALAPPVG